MARRTYVKDMDDHRPVTYRVGPFVELQQSMPSRVDAISPVVDEVLRFIARFRVADGSEFEIELALREALANAVIHGNKNDLIKSVHVVCRCGIDGEVFITVGDEGEGFDMSTMSDPTAPDKQLLPNGRGIYLIRTSMDMVDFHDDGTVVEMRKKPAGAGKERRGHENETSPNANFAESRPNRKAT